MIQQAQAAAGQKTPTPAEEKDTSAADLNKARAEEIRFNLTGQSPNDQLEYMSMAMGEPKVYNG